MINEYLEARIRFLKTNLRYYNMFTNFWIILISKDDIYSLTISACLRCTKIIIIRYRVHHCLQDYKWYVQTCITNTMISHLHQMTNLISAIISSIYLILITPINFFCWQYSFQITTLLNDIIFRPIKFSISIVIFFTSSICFSFIIIIAINWIKKIEHR